MEDANYLPRSVSKLVAATSLNREFIFPSSRKNIDVKHVNAMMGWTGQAQNDGLAEGIAMELQREFKHLVDAIRVDIRHHFEKAFQSSEFANGQKVKKFCQLNQWWREGYSHQW